MEQILRNNIFLKTFETKLEYKLHLLNLIKSGRLQRVMYHGNGADLHLKFAKKILFSRKEYDEHTIPADGLKEKINLIHQQPICIIYKKLNAEQDEELD